jgi:hypothetical protein
MDNKTSGKLSIKDAIRLKHETNKDITYGGLNARQIRELEELSQEQYGDIKEAIVTIKKSWWVFPDYLFWIFMLLGGLGIFIFSNTNIRIIASIIAVYFLTQLYYRKGVYYGFMRGYEDGHVMRVRKAMKIDKDEAKDIHDRAIEMEIDENLIERMDQKK